MALSTDYPWTSKSKPLVVSAPMMKISLAHYALATSAAGGIGFLAGGFDLTPLKDDLAEADQLTKAGEYEGLSLHNNMLPIGVGIQNWGADINLFLSALKAYPVAAVWFFAPKKIADLEEWARVVRNLNSAIKIWVQVGSVAEAKEAASLVRPDVFVIQGSDAGGHGLAQRAGIITLLPEVADMLAKDGHSIPLVAAGGIIDGRATAAALALGADGICLGTRLLASKEAKIAKGYQNEVLRASDGGISTIGSTVYDKVRGIKGWPTTYHGRGVINQSFLDAQAGVPAEENEQKYCEEMKKGDEGWGPAGRMTTYAGTGIGLVKEVMSIEQIVSQTQKEAIEILTRVSAKLSV